MKKVRTCRICKSPEVDAINKARLIDKMPIRELLERFGHSKSAYYRHFKEHLPSSLLKAKEARDMLAADNLYNQLNRTYMRMQKQQDACDAFLQDPDDPQAYFLGPRGGDIDCLVMMKQGENVVQIKKNLQTLIDELEKRFPDARFVEISYKYADLRKMNIEASRELRVCIELFSRMLGQIKDGLTVNVNFKEQAHEIIEILAPFPKAQRHLTRRLAEEYESQN